MGEGVDPTQMCQSLVDKVARSEQLRAIADPDLLGLFEDWLEELESEARAIMTAKGALDAPRLAAELGLSRRGATFLLSKLMRQERQSDQE